MKINKKILLRGSLLPMAIATPVVVAVSCGNSINHASDIKKSKLETLQEKYSNISPVAYNVSSVKNLGGFFENFISKIDKTRSKELKIQAIKTLDSAIIAFDGYLSSDGTKPKATKEEILKSKINFSNELKTFKKDFDDLLKIVIGDPKSGSSIISPVINQLITTAELGGKQGAQIAKNADAVLALLLTKVKTMTDNVLDTMINVEHETKPEFMNSNTIKEVGNLTEKEKLKNNGINIDLIKTAFFKGFSNKQLFYKKGKTYYITKDFRFPASLVSIKINVKEHKLKNTPWQIGEEMLNQQIKTNPKNVVVYKDTKSNKIYFKLKTTTTTLLNDLNSNIKFNETHMDSLLNDKLLKSAKPIINDVLKDLKKDGNIGIIGLLLGNFLNMFKIMNADNIATFFERLDMILEDFGKTIQFTELNLQSFTSNLLGNQASYYGGIEKQGESSYKLIPNAFISPQFDIYKYKNYQPYNNTKSANEAVKNSFWIRKLGANINVLEMVQNITKDPMSNYTIGTFQLAEILTKGLKLNI